MKALLIIAASVAMSSIGFAADAAHTAAPAAPAAAAAPAAQEAAAAPAPAMHAKGKHAMASKETIKKCKAEHKGDKKAYMECLKAAN